MYIYILKLDDMIITKKNSVDNFKKFLNDDRSSGVKKAYYFFHNESGNINAIDTDEQFNDFKELYAKQGILPHKEMVIDGKKLGVKYIKLHIFKKNGHCLSNAMGDNNRYYFDHISFSCDYLTADDETSVAQIIL